MGLPAMNITFVARAQNSAKRLDRGFVGMVLKDAKVPSGNPVTIFSSEDIPEELGTDNKNQIALALRGNDTAPQKVVVYVLATAETDYSKAFKYFERKKVDWMCFPSAKKDSQTQKITDWVKAQREAHNRVKAVLPETEADTEGIVNYATKTVTADGKSYTAETFCSRIAGLIAGTGSDQSVTFAVLDDVTACEDLDRKSVEAAIDAGKFVLFDDGEKIKVDVDIGESTRAADSLIKNFGVSAREAFNLMAQGAQNGLDFSGELFDNIDEYSVQFQKLGLDAEDMFSIFANGAENGAFNLDKIGDAVKEFSIRAIDGSDTTKQGFEAIGMNADKMAKRFAAGGQDAKAAFNEVIQGLAGMDDPVAQSAAGVNLFGTMWEDLGPQVITTLSTTNGAIDKTKETMEELVNTRYDTLTGALGGLWRTIQVDVLQPVGTMLIPYVEQGITVIDSLVDHWNELDPATQKTIVKFAAVAAATGPVLLGAGKVSTGIGGMITNFGKVSGAIMRLTNGAGGFKVLGAVMTGPAGIAIVAIAAGALLIYKNWDKISPLLGKTAARFEAFWSTVQPQLQPFLGLCTEIGSYLESGFIKAVQFVFSEGSDVIVIFFEGASQYIDGFLGVLEGVTTFMNGVFTGNWEKAWKGLRDIVSNSFGMLEALVKTPMNAVISIVNGAISRINSIHFTVPDWVLGIGGKSWKGLNIPQIPTLSKGTDNWQGGIVQISEKGGEIVDLPRGTRVYPHDESVRMARSENKGTVITIAKLADSIIVREEADIDRIAERIVQKVKETNDNLPQTAVA